MQRANFGFWFLVNYGIKYPVSYFKLEEFVVREFCNFYIAPQHQVVDYLTSYVDLLFLRF